MPRRRGGGSSAKSGGLFGKKAAPAPNRGTRTGGGLFGSRKPANPPPPRPTAPATRAPPPAQAHAPPPAPASSGGGMLSGLGGMVAQGMAIGTGSAIAHQAVGGIANAMSGGSKSSHDAPESAPASHGSSNDSARYGSSATACALDEQEFLKCLQENEGSASACQYYYDALQNCQQNNAFH